MSDKVLNNVPYELLQRVLDPVTSEQYINSKHELLDLMRAQEDAQPHPIAAQSAPDEREAVLLAGNGLSNIAYNLAQLEGVPLSRYTCELLRMQREQWDKAVAAWQRAQSAPVVPEGWRVSVVDYGNRTGEASISGPGVYCMQVPVSYSMLDFMQALAASYRRNQSEPAAHEGWRPVPVEPTEEMIDAGCREHTCVQGDSWYSDSEISEHDAIAVFKAMLAAAPQPAVPVAECTNEDSWNCKYCRKTETCAALKDERNFGAPPKAARQEQGDEVRRKLVERIQAAVSTVIVPATMAPSRAEYYKAGARHIIAKVNEALSASAEGKA